MVAECITPEDREILDTFYRNLLLIRDRYEEQDEASSHGESDPEFAEIFEGLTQNMIEAGPHSAALLLQSMGAAVLATVREYQGRGPR